MGNDGTLSAAYDYTDFGETEELTGGDFDNQISMPIAMTIR